MVFPTHDDETVMEGAPGFGREDGEFGWGTRAFCASG